MFAALATVLASVAIPAVSGATTNTTTTSAHMDASRTVHRSTVQGTAGDDTIITKRRAQRVLALAGNDYVRLGSSNDLAYGDAGDDWLHGNDGKDAVYGGPGNDHPQGGTGNDYVSGGSGDDELDGDAGNDLIFAGYRQRLDHRRRGRRRHLPRSGCRRGLRRGRRQQDRRHRRRRPRRHLLQPDRGAGPARDHRLHRPPRPARRPAQLQGRRQEALRRLLVAVEPARSRHGLAGAHPARPTIGHPRALA